MSMDGCQREMEVARAARVGVLGGELREHVRVCASCAEVIRVSAWMRDLARAPVARPLPDPSVLWWKAQLVRRWDAERRAVGPIDAMQRVETGAALAALAVLLYFLWPSFAAWISHTPLPWAGWADLAARPASPVTAIVAVGGFALALAMTMIATNWVFDE